MTGRGVINARKGKGIPPKFGIKSKSGQKKLSKKKQNAAENASYLTNHIIEMLAKAGFNYNESQKRHLYNLILDNDGKYRYDFLEDCGLAINHLVLREMYERVPLLYDGIGNEEQATVDFDRNMEALLKRKATGEHIFMYFMRMRSRDHKIWYTTYAQVKNHWELSRMIEILENSEHELGWQGFGGMAYHMVIEGKHYDCVPLDTGDLPIEWTLRVEIPSCNCGTVNWEKSGFVGGDWI